MRNRVKAVPRNVVAFLLGPRAMVRLASSITSPYKKDVKYSTLNQLQLDLQKAIGRCGEGGLSASPVVNTHIDIKDSQGTVVDTLTINLSASQRALGGAMLVTLDSTGLLKINLTPQCRWTYDANREMNQGMANARRTFVQKTAICGGINIAFACRSSNHRKIKTVVPDCTKR
jgi:hypothetical protein